MSQKSVVLKHWARIIKQWPVDKVRPEYVSFQKVMQDHLNKVASARAAAQNVTSNNEVLATPTEPSQINQQKAMKQINALYNLLDDRFVKEFPMPAQTRHPQSRPTHYDDVVKEMGEAATRTWVASMYNRIRGMLRFS
ncbi:hypothetical protein EDD37DRAFT_613507 [Exophiala viscosa]|uniref:uncharacterized protein n=1 Tax=Exophiala viscosa TaxID=2486360 RepID=UPI00218F949C|nr:hypothetical protein EDD37DRAFT_613507 [Exophiala viscosa]